MGYVAEIPFAAPIQGAMVYGTIYVGEKPTETRLHGYVNYGGVPIGEFDLNGSHWVTEVGNAAISVSIQIDVNQRFVDVGAKTALTGFSGWQRAVNF